MAPIGPTAPGAPLGSRSAHFRSPAGITTSRLTAVFAELLPFACPSSTAGKANAISNVRKFPILIESPSPSLVAHGLRDWPTGLNLSPHAAARHCAQPSLYYLPSSACEPSRLAPGRETCLNQFAS